MDFLNKVGFGCVGLSTQSSEKNALKLLGMVFNEGVTHFDTAPLYGRGYSEKILGKFLKQHRKQVTITTKFGISGIAQIKIPAMVALPLNYLKSKVKAKPNFVVTFHQPDTITFRKIGLSDVKFDFENSIKNLSTDYIDNYFIHEGLPTFMTDEALKYVFDLKKNGAVRNLGIAASYTNIETLKPELLEGWDILQYENSLLHPSENLLEVFNSKVHFYHSIFKPLKFNNYKEELKTDIAGILLSRALKLNPNGKLLFSTSNIAHYKHNLKVADTYNNYSLTEINNTLQNAIY